MNKPECVTTNNMGEQVMAHSHYRTICHAYPGPNGEVMVAGYALSGPLERWLRQGRPKHSFSGLAERPQPPCPECGTPLKVDRIEIPSLGTEDGRWVPGRLSCPAEPRHAVKAAYTELSWPAELTDEDRTWLRQQNRLTDEAS